MQAPGAALAAALLVSSVAFADQVPEPAPEPEPEPAPAPPKPDAEASGGTSTTYDHRGQLTLYMQGGVGYRVIFRYDEDDFCGQAAASVCSTMAPPYLELGLGYAFTSHVELLVDVRLSLIGDFRPETSMAGKPRVLAFQPGIRFYIDDEGSVKWFTAFQVSIDRTDYSASGVATSTDVGVRNTNGLLIDLHRTFGVYVYFGETLSFVRWMRFEVDGGIGMQARFP